MKTISNTLWIAILILSILNINSAFGADYYVTEGGSGDKKGSNWENAMGNNEFSASLENAGAGDIYYVASGTYRPVGEITNAYTLKPGVSIYGSFKRDLSGTAHDYSEGSAMREIRSASGELSPKTIFTGDQNGNELADTGDKYLLVAAINEVPGAPNVINGIHFTTSVHGGLIAEHADITLQYCKFSGISGHSGAPQVGGYGVVGGVIRSFYGNLTIEYSEITGNTMTQSLVDYSFPFCGTIWVKESNLTLKNSFVANNNADGGVIFAGNNSNSNEEYNVTIYNSTITENTNAINNDHTHSGVITIALDPVNRQYGLRIINSTIANNTSNETFGGILLPYQIIDWGGQQLSL